jgi:hypothetical protein
VVRCTATVTEDRLLALAEEAQGLVTPGQLVAIDLDVEGAAAATTSPNEAFLAMLAEISEMKKGMAGSDPSLTDQIIRKGRAGDMYGA